MKKRSLILLATGGVLLLATTLWYVFSYKVSEVMGLSGYLFLILAELVLFGGLLLVDLLLPTKKNIFLSTPFLILLGYFVLSVGVSLYFMLKPIDKKGLFTVIQVLFLATSSLLLFLMLAAERSTPSIKFTELQWDNPLREGTNRIRALKDDPENEPFKDSLKTLYDRFVFLDSTLKREQDEAILKGIKELEISLVSLDDDAQEKKEKVQKRIAQLEQLLKEREYEIYETPWSV